MTCSSSSQNSAAPLLFVRQQAAEDPIAKAHGHAEEARRGRVLCRSSDERGVLAQIA